MRQRCQDGLKTIIMNEKSMVPELLERNHIIKCKRGQVQRRQESSVAKNSYQPDHARKTLKRKITKKMFR